MFKGGGYLVAWIAWKCSGRQWAEGFMVIGSSGVMVRQEAAKRARPRTGIRSRDFMVSAGVGDS